MKSKEVEANDDDDRKEGENSYPNHHPYGALLKEAHMKNTVVGEGGCGLVEGGQGEDTAQEPGQHTESGTAAVAEETVEVLGVTHVHVAAQRDAHQ